MAQGFEVGVISFVFPPTLPMGDSRGSDPRDQGQPFRDPWDNAQEGKGAPGDKGYQGEPWAYKGKGKDYYPRRPWVRFARDDEFRVLQQEMRDVRATMESLSSEQERFKTDHQRRLEVLAERGDDFDQRLNAYFDERVRPGVNAILDQHWEHLYEELNEVNRKLNQNWEQLYQFWNQQKEFNLKVRQELDELKDMYNTLEERMDNYVIRHKNLHVQEQEPRIDFMHRFSRPWHGRVTRLNDWMLQVTTSMNKFIDETSQFLGDLNVPISPDIRDQLRAYKVHPPADTASSSSSHEAPLSRVLESEEEAQEEHIGYPVSSPSSQLHLGWQDQQGE